MDIFRSTAVHRKKTLSLENKVCFCFKEMTVTVRIIFVNYWPQINCNNYIHSLILRQALKTHGRLPRIQDQNNFTKLDLQKHDKPIFVYSVHPSMLQLSVTPGRSTKFVNTTLISFKGKIGWNVLAVVSSSIHAMLMVTANYTDTIRLVKRGTNQKHF